MQRRKSGVSDVQARKERHAWIGRRDLPAGFLLAIALLVLCVGVASATSGPGDEPAEAPLTAEGAGSVDIEPTDPQAAMEMPHEELKRDEALELMSSVFSPVLQGAAGVFDDLEVEKFYSDNVAVIGPGEAPRAEGEAEDGEQPTLLQSGVPLATENDDGHREAVDLSLEAAAGALSPVNPLVDVRIPEQLGEGISLPEMGIGIRLAGSAVDRSPSLLEGSTAFYPNVASETDLTVAPTPRGVETLTQLRSTSSPTSQTFEFDLPSGASLNPTKEGGAEVVDGGAAIASIPPATALDANGDEVPVQLEVSGDDLRVSVSPAEDAAYPILVDPLVERPYVWLWNHSFEGMADWSTWRNPAASTVPYEFNFAQEGYVTGVGFFPGLTITTGIGNAPKESVASWNYFVPRYESDFKATKTRPTTFIKFFQIHRLWYSVDEGILRPINPSPFFRFGLWNEVIPYWTAEGHRFGDEGNLHDLDYLYQAQNPQEQVGTKQALIEMESFEPKMQYRELLVGEALIELSDKDAPAFGSVGSPSGWVNNEATSPISFTASDPGLGVKELIAKQPEIGGGTRQVVTSGGCVGIVSNPCPRTWKSANPPQAALKYEPALMPQGENWIQIEAVDPIGHRSPEEGHGVSEVRIKVDHTPPAVVLSGTMTEQGALGTKRSSYVLKVNATDGTEAAPQSGVAKYVIEVDKKVVSEKAPGCATKNCSLSPEWTLEASQYAEGSHTVKVTVTDAAGISTTKTPMIELHPSPPPSLSLAGSMTQQATLGPSRPRYILKANASALAMPDGWGETTFSSAFGSAGNALGQFNHAGDVAIDPKGNLWVVDKANNRIQQFTESGGLPKAFGSLGATGGKLNAPSGIAIDPSGNVWVTDTGNTRVAKFNEKGEFLATFGTNVNKTKVESGGTKAEKNLCTAASKNICQAGTAGSLEGQLKEPMGIAAIAGGNLFVVEKGNGRVEKFSPTGEILANFGKPGSNEGQLKEPTAVVVAPDGSLWVADTGNNRIQQWTSTYSFVRVVGKEGSGNGEFKGPNAIETDSVGNVLVADQGNGRIQEFTQNGTFMARFGASGSGPGQFIFSNPAGIAVNGKGEIWVTDTDNNRIQKWTRQIPKSEIATKIKIDGKQVSTGQASCASESCPITPEWTLESPTYSVGKHTVEVIASDGLGRSTTKTLSIEIQRDATKPALESSGSLVNAPEGWVEQESYGLNASATDAGYGLTSLIAKIDGEQVASWSNSCLDGGCQATIAKTIDMSSYSGGAHPAEIVATDGAGNVASKKWAINVDPKGHVSTEELTATLEAAEETGPINLIGQAQQEDLYEGSMPGLEVQSVEDGLEVTGGAAPTEIAAQPKAGFIVEVPRGASVSCGNTSEEESNKAFTGQEEEALPVGPSDACKSPPLGLTSINVTPMTVSEAAGSSVASPEDSAAVVPNLLPSVDLVTRPLYDGAMTFAAIRDTSAPEAYSWTVQLEADQELVSIDSRHAEVYFEGGHPAFGITAVPAHDAIGTAVNTVLSVEAPNIVTLTVNHRETVSGKQKFVYPVTAGTGWEGGFQTYVVQMPPPEAPPEEECGECEEEIFIEDHALHLAMESYGPPVAEASSSTPAGAAKPSSVQPMKRGFNFDECAWISDQVNPQDPGAVPSDPHFRAQLSQQCHGHLEGGYGAVFSINYAMSLSGTFHYKWGHWVWVNGPPTCRKWGPSQPTLVHCHMVSWGPSSSHLDVIGDFRFRPGVVNPAGPTCYTLDGVLPIRPVLYPADEPVYHGKLHNPHVSVSPDDSCPWGHFENPLGR